MGVLDGKRLSASAVGTAGIVSAVGIVSTAGSAGTVGTRCCSRL